jgi:DNA-directed RNA polymerase subunit beta'
LVFNDILPPGMPFYNCAPRQEGLRAGDRRLSPVLRPPATIDLLDNMKAIGFKRSHAGGVVLRRDDMRIPQPSRLLDAGAEARSIASRRTTSQASSPSASATTSCSTSGARDCNEELTKELRETLKLRPPGTGPSRHRQGRGQAYLNPVYLMTDSGARGNVTR